MSVHRTNSVTNTYTHTHTHVVNGLFTRVPKNANNCDNGLLFITNQCTNAYHNVCVKEAVQ